MNTTTTRGTGIHLHGHIFKKRFVAYYWLFIINSGFFTILNIIQIPNVVIHRRRLSCANNVQFLKELSFIAHVILVDNNGRYLLLLLLFAMHLLCFWKNVILDIFLCLISILREIFIPGEMCVIFLLIIDKAFQRNGSESDFIKCKILLEECDDNRPMIYV